MKSDGVVFVEDENVAVFVECRDETEVEGVAGRVVAVAGDDAGDARGEDRVHAGRRAAEVRAGLQRDVERGSPRAVPGLAQGLDLGMGSADLSMPAAADN